jgi:diacylglycerol O-acyltransferase / wax synthase
VRPNDDEGIGNAITFIVATLGTDIADPAERFETIRRSVRHAKEHVQSLPRQAMEQYTVLLMAPMIATMLSGIGGRVRPMFNVTISNVPGPDKPLYFRGAELLAIYPVSIVTQGQALNITCQSYAGSMDFGFTGCHSSVPSLQKMALHTLQALEELESVFLPTPKATRRMLPPPAPASVPKRAKATRKRVPGRALGTATDKGLGKTREKTPIRSPKSAPARAPARAPKAPAAR